MSAKKKKRLDAYIERKLKKEQRKDLIASLACVRPSQQPQRRSC